MNTNFDQLHERFHTTNEDAHYHLSHILGQPQFYTNRELSWLAFNERVLEEAKDLNNPLLERLKFLAIFSSNLDEFFMVRVANLYKHIRIDSNKRDNKSGLTVTEQIERIVPYVQVLLEHQNAIYHQLVEEELPKEHIHIVSIADLTKTEKQLVEERYRKAIFPTLTPIILDKEQSFPLLPGKCLHLSVKLDNQLTGIVQIPSTLERLIRIPSKNKVFIFLEDVIMSHIQQLFPDHTVQSVHVFRLTRSGDHQLDFQDSHDIIQGIERMLERREWGDCVRLETQTSKWIQHLKEGLSIDDRYVFEVNGRLDYTFLFDFIREVSLDQPHLLYEKFVPAQPRDLSEGENIFDKSLRQDLFFHYPYESFNPMIDFLAGAANDPDVVEIKQTLYRVSHQSPIVQALKQAAINGKHVTVLIELKARFDEANNLSWARELERVGCHVIYDVKGLKTHSKITFVVRKKAEKIEHFVHIGTGNYNEETAMMYTDMGIFTTNKELGEDANTFFQFLNGSVENPTFHHLVISPFHIRQKIMALIDKEIAYHQMFGNGFIRAKMNALTDKKIIKKLYEASMKGVKIDLIIRGICCLKPGIKGISDNITVRSIVGRFLEHSRVYWFHHNGENKMYLSSADLMTRNMVKRIEILLPVYATHIKQRIQQIIQLQLHDQMKARILDCNGEYHYVQPNERRVCTNSQEQLIKEGKKETIDPNEGMHDATPHNRTTII